jgi:hypothetical protein
MNGITRYLPLTEANSDQNLYTQLAGLAQQSLDAWNAINDAASFELLDTNPTHLSPQRLDRVIQLTETALEKHIEFGYSYGRLAYEYPNLPHAITWVNLHRVRPSALELDPHGMAAADLRTTDRVNAGLHALDLPPSITRALANLRYHGRTPPCSDPTTCLSTSSPSASD